MSNQIPTHYAQLFTDGIQLDQQQNQSRLRGAVRVESVVNGDRAYFDKMPATSMTEITERHADTAITDTGHTRRMVTTKLYGKASLVDVRDELRVLNSPVNAYTQTFAASANRQTDQVIINAAFAAASTGVSGGTSTSHPGSHQIASSSAGLTLVKLIQARKILLENEAADQPLFLVYNGEQLEDILNDTTITSIDYNNVKMLMTGEISTFMGFNWIHSELLNTVSGERAVIAFAKDSLLLGIAMDVTAEVDRLPGKNHSLQVAFRIDIGATRMDEVGVVRILCTE